MRPSPPAPTEAAHRRRCYETSAQRRWKRARRAPHRRIPVPGAPASRAPRATHTRSPGAPPSVSYASSRCYDVAPPGRGSTNEAEMTSNVELRLSIVHQIAQPVRDLERAIKFYRDKLGATLITTFDPPGLAFFDLDGVRLMLDVPAGSNHPGSTILLSRRRYSACHRRAPVAWRHLRARAAARPPRRRRLLRPGRSGGVDGVLPRPGRQPARDRIAGRRRDLSPPVRPPPRPLRYDRGCRRAGVAQSVEHLLPKQRVASSSLVSRSTSFVYRAKPGDHLSSDLRVGGSNPPRRRQPITAGERGATRAGIPNSSLPRPVHPATSSSPATTS